MKNTRRRQRGFTLLETVVAASLLSLVLGSSLALLDASNDLAQSASHQRSAAMRVDRGLSVMRDALRKGSIASARLMDGTTFSDGDNDIGMGIRPIEGWNGSALEGNLIEYTLAGTAGPDGQDLIRREGAVVTTLARGITRLDVRRVGNVFTFEVEATAGPNDDRRRTASGSVRAMARNP